MSSNLYGASHRPAQAAFAQTVFRKRFRPNDASSGFPAGYAPDIAQTLFIRISSRSPPTRFHIVIRSLFRKPVMISVQMS